MTTKSTFDYRMHDEATPHEMRCILAMEIYHAGSSMLALGMPDYKPHRYHVESPHVGASFIGAIELQLSLLDDETLSKFMHTEEDARRMSIFDAGDMLMIEEAGRARWAVPEPDPTEMAKIKTRMERIPPLKVEVPPMVAALVLSTSVQLVGTYTAYFQGAKAGNAAAKRMMQEAAKQPEQEETRHLN